MKRYTVDRIIVVTFKYILLLTNTQPTSNLFMEILFLFCFSMSQKRSQIRSLFTSEDKANVGALMSKRSGLQKTCCQKNAEHSSCHTSNPQLKLKGLPEVVDSIDILGQLGSSSNSNSVRVLKDRTNFYPSSQLQPARMLTPPLSCRKLIWALHSP